jgi:hypothetical protein
MFTYVDDDVFGLPQVWIRSPGGLQTQVTEFNEPSTVLALSLDGAVALTNQGRLYISRAPYDELTDISSDAGSGPVFWQNDILNVAIGRSLFEATP